MRRMLLLPLVLALVFATGGVANADTFTVNHTGTDGVDANVGDGKCRTAVGECTLRAAVQEANATAQQDSIVLPSAQTAHLTIGSAGTASAATGDLDVLHNIEVKPSGAAPATIDGGDVDRIFDVPSTDPSPNIALFLSSLVLRNGRVTAENGGGAVRSSGYVSVTDVRVTSSDALQGGGIDGQGGGILTRGTASILSLARTRVDGNSATTGGGVANLDGTALFQGVSIDGNESRSGESGSAGGIRNRGALTVINATFSGNADNGGNGGGALFNASGIDDGQVKLVHVTIAGNTSPLGSAIRDISAAGRFVNVSSSVVLGTCNGKASTSTAPHHNIGGGATCGLNDPTDAPSGTATLGALADNGGGTPTRKLIPGPGVDGVDDIPPNVCTSQIDQRGGRRGIGGGCDVGAYELNSLADLKLTGSAPLAATVGDDLAYSYSVGAAGPDAATGVTLHHFLPAGVTFVSATAAGGTCSATSTLVTCLLGGVAIGSPRAVTVVVRPTAANPALSPLAEIFSDQFDPTTASLHLTTAVTAAPDPVPPACGTPGADACPSPPPSPPHEPQPSPPCGTLTAAPCVDPLTITGLRATPARFRARAGTRLRFSLARGASVKLSFSGPIKRKRRPTAGSVIAAGKAGVNSVRFRGRLRGRRLRPGRYRVTATATAGTETATAAKPITVRVLRQPRRASAKR